MKSVYRSHFETATSLLLFAVAVPIAFAQPMPGNCELGTASGTLDVNDVSAMVYSTGSLFSHRDVSFSQYIVPVETDISPIYASTLWIGGLVDDELRIAATEYGQPGPGQETTGYEFWPGPLNEGGSLPNPDDCSAWDRIWDVSREDIADYDDTGIPTTDLAEWPYDLGAPVVDGDGNPDNYDLEAGDRPELIGDQALWWILNDVGNEHLSTQSDPIGMEVRVQPFAFSTDDALDEATFYKFTLAYRGEEPLEEARLALWADPDLGHHSNDLIGSDTTRSMGYVYNETKMDSQYGIPPALGYTVLQGPLVPSPGETWEDPDGTIYENMTRVGMTVFMRRDDLVGTTGYPTEGAHYWNYMNALWKDDAPLEECGLGYQCGGEVTTFAFSGNPIAGKGWVQPEGFDIVFIVSTGPFTMQPGDEQEIIVAIVFGWGEDRLDSITELRAASDLAQDFYENNFPVADESGPEGIGALALFSRPNPADRSTPLTFSLEAPSEITLEVYDALGRRITAVEGQHVAAGPAEIALSTERWRAGTYIVRLQAEDRVDRHRFVVVH